MLVGAGLSSVDNIIQKIDNDDQDVASVAVDVVENVEVVSVGAVAVGRGGKSVKRPRLPWPQCWGTWVTLLLPDGSISNAPSLIYLFIPLFAISVGDDWSV